MTDTIAAVSTPFGEGAVALLRMSGPRAMVVAEAVWRGRRRVAELPARHAELGEIHEEGRKLDEVLLTVFRAPASYTGEDVVEIAGHGGVLVARRILELLLRHGARAAQPGEFTQRAFLGGKMDLTQAEAVMDLITAQTDLALSAANEQLEGRLGALILALRENVLGLLAHVEAFIDFPDEDIDPDTGAALLGRLDAVRQELDALLATAERGKILREGLRTVIYGAPNVGKSSLLNVLLGHERAIVSPRPGTTRDVIEEVVNLHGIPLRLIDTAGVRPSDDDIEQAGMERTRRQVERADLVLHVVDASTASGPETEPPAPGREVLRVLNKIDLGEHLDWAGAEGVRVSCLRGEGVEALAKEIAARALGGGAVRRDWSVAINTRHEDCLMRARAFCEAARDALGRRLSPEFIAEELRGALEAVGEVAGRMDSEDVLGRIFATFCIGK